MLLSGFRDLLPIPRARLLTEGTSYISLDRRTREPLRGSTINMAIVLVGEYFSISADPPPPPGAISTPFAQL